MRTLAHSLRVEEHDRYLDCRTPKAQGAGHRALEDKLFMKIGAHGTVMIDSRSNAGMRRSFMSNRRRHQ